MKLLIEAIRVLVDCSVEALSAISGFIVVEAVKVHEEALRMAVTAETVERP